MDIPNASPRLYNEDLAPAKDRRWGAFSIFNVWTSDVHSSWGYYLAASLFLLCGSFLNFVIGIGLREFLCATQFSYTGRSPGGLFGSVCKHLSQLRFMCPGAAEQ